MENRMSGPDGETHATGGCQCGAVRYRVTQPLGSAGLCHCRMCQRATGNVLAPLVGAHGVLWSGTPARWASSNLSERGFCAHCGTPLFLRDLDRDDEIELMIGTLDDPRLAPPDHHYGIESRVPWLRLADDLPGWETGGQPGESQQRIISHQSPAGSSAGEER